MVFFFKQPLHCTISNYFRITEQRRCLLPVKSVWGVPRSLMSISISSNWLNTDKKSVAKLLLRVSLLAGVLSVLGYSAWGLLMWDPMFFFIGLGTTVMLMESTPSTQRELKAFLAQTFRGIKLPYILTSVKFLILTCRTGTRIKVRFRCSPRRRNWEASSRSQSRKW